MIYNFKNLKVDRIKNRYNTDKAPHKAILLLSIIQLFENNLIDLGKIFPTDNNLIETYQLLWECLEYNKIGPIYLPFFHLKSDKFWILQFKCGFENTRSIKSLKHLCEAVEYASFEKDFQGNFKDEQFRKLKIEELLYGGYFNSKEIERLKSELNIISESYNYENEILQKVNTEFSLEDSLKDFFSEKSRDISFRRIICNSYNFKCALCGISLILECGINIVDAAHILPFNKFKNDDPRNGLCLCKTHHWLFDKGIFTIKSDYSVKITKTILKQEPSDLIAKFNNITICLPETKNFIPALIAFEWHNKNVFLG